MNPVLYIHPLIIVICYSFLLHLIQTKTHRLFQLWYLPECHWHHAVSSIGRHFHVECNRKAEKGFFSEPGARLCRVNTPREAPFISYANLRCTWPAADSRLPVGSTALSFCHRRPLAFHFLTGSLGEVAFVVLHISPIGGLTEVGERLNPDWQLLLDVHSVFCITAMDPCQM